MTFLFAELEDLKQRGVKLLLWRAARGGLVGLGYRRQLVVLGSRGLTVFS